MFVDYNCVQINGVCCLYSYYCERVYLNGHEKMQFFLIRTTLYILRFLRCQRWATYHPIHYMLLMQIGTDYVGVYKRHIERHRILLACTGQICSQHDGANNTNEDNIERVCRDTNTPRKWGSHALYWTFLPWQTRCRKIAFSTKYNSWIIAAWTDLIKNVCGNCSAPYEPLIYRFYPSASFLAAFNFCRRCCWFLINWK